MFIVMYSSAYCRGSKIHHGHLIMGAVYERAGLSLINATCVYGCMRLSIAKSHRKVA